MQKILNFLFFLFLVSLVLGQFGRFDLGFVPIVFYIHDIILFLLITAAIIYFFGFQKKFLLPKGGLFVLIFVLIGGVSLINSLRFFPLNQVFVGSLFLFRFLGFFFLYLIFVNLFRLSQLEFWSNLLIWQGVVLAILGFFQLIFFYDLTFLQDFGFDPHIGRVVSTFLDPNFFGGFQVLILNLAAAKFLESKNKRLLISCVILFTSIILTFSRSTYLALFTSVFLFGILKSKQLAVATFLGFILLTPAIPRIIERILGAVTLDITAAARIESWLQAFAIFSLNPILGVGFNNLRFAKASLGFFEPGSGLGGHSGAGIDSSFLHVLATTGIFGIIAFMSFYLFFILKFFMKKQNPYTLAAFISLIAIFIHAQFVNSLFFPWITAIFWVKMAAADVASSVKNYQPTRFK